MKFKIFFIDNGYFNEAQIATSLGLKRTSGGWIGWITREELEHLDRSDYYFKVIY